MIKLTKPELCADLPEHLRRDEHNWDKLMACLKLLGDQELCAKYALNGNMGTTRKQRTRNCIVAAERLTDQRWVEYVLLRLLEYSPVWAISLGKATDVEFLRNYLAENPWEDIQRKKIEKRIANLTAGK